MAHVQDVAAYILQERGPMTAMKLQKLCYYSYGYHLAWEGGRLFPESFEAWANGPVVRRLYRLHQGRFEIRDGEIDGRPELLTDSERESIDAVLEGYGHLTAYRLSQLTHRESPWRNARSRAGAEPDDRCDELITDEDIEIHFAQLADSER